MKKKVLALILVLAMALSLGLAGCSSDSGNSASGGGSASSGGGGSVTPAADPVTFKFAGTVAADQPASLHMAAIKENVEKATEGRLLFDLYPANALGDAEVVIQGVMDGAIDMMLGYISATYDPRFNVNSFPVLLANWDDAAKQNDPDSNWNRIQAEACESIGVVYLGNHADGFCGISSKKQPDNYADPTKPKNAVIRCVNQTKSKVLLESQGYQSIGLAWAEVYTSIESGICDGSSGQSANSVYQNFRDLIKYYVPVNMTIDPMSYIANPASLDKLSDEDEQILRDAVHAEVMDAIEQGPSIEEAAYDKLEEAGVTILPLTDDEIRTIHDKIWQDVGPVMVDLLGQEVVDQCRADIA